MNRKNSAAYRVSIMGILTALLLLQAFVPMFGYIRITGGVAITTMHLTVITAAVVLGTRSGVMMGLIWGIISLTVAWTVPSDPMTILLFRNPIIAIVPRVLVGLVAGLLANSLRKHVPETVRLMLAGVGGALTNTALVIAFTWLFYASKAAPLIGHGASSQNLGWVMIAVLGVNAIAEAIAAGLIIPILGRALLRLRRN